MEDFNEVLETQEASTKPVPEIVKVLAILSYIGNGFWILAFGWMYFYMSSNLALFEELVQGRIDTEVLTTVILTAFLVSLGLGILSIVGAAKMAKGKKNGFIFYAIGNGLWVALLLFGSLDNGQATNYILILVSVAFLVLFGSHLKNLN